MRSKGKEYRAQNRIARLFMNHNSETFNDDEMLSRYNLGLKVQLGKIEKPVDILKAVSILEVLAKDGKLERSEVETLKISLAENLVNYKLVPNG